MDIFSGAFSPMQFGLQSLIVILSYLLGSIPWALIIGKIVKKIDIRQYGSKNMGATNVLRVLGPKWGLVVFLLDASKGALPIIIFKYIMPNITTINFIHPLFLGLAAFIGHLFPIYAKFKGGKGVSTAAGCIIAYAPNVAIFGILAFIIAVSITKYISFGSICAALFTMIFSFIIPHPIDYTFSIVMIVVTILITIRHIPNIKRILHHQESKINFKVFKDPTQPSFILEDNKKNENK